MFWSGQENFGSSYSKPHLTFWPLWVLKICVLTLSKSWNVCDKSHSNKMGAALQSLRPVDQLKNSNISKFSCNYWFFWKFMHFDTFITDTLSKSFFSIPHFNSGIDHFILLKWGIDFRNWIPNAGIEHFILLKWGIHFRNWELMPEVNSFTLLIKSGIDFRHRFPIPTSFRR